MNLTKGAFWFAVSIFVQVVSGVELKWLNPTYGPYHWREISRTVDGIMIPGSGGILKSSGSGPWSLHSQDPGALFFSIAEGNGKFLAAVAGTRPPASDRVPMFYVSTNGTDFKWLRDAPQHVYNIVYGNGRFVAAGFQMWWSEDGVVWNQITTVPESNVFQQGDLIVGGGRFVRATGSGSVFVSDDGILWEETGLPGTQRLSYFNGTYVAAGEGFVSFSTNAHNWKTSEVPMLRPVLSMAVGSAGTVVAGDSLSVPTAEMIFTADGTNWAKFNLPFSNRPWDIQFINGTYLMVGSAGLVARSNDGTNWIQEASGTDSPSLRAMAMGSGRLIAVGEGGAGAMSTTNGVDWRPLEIASGRRLTAITHYEGKFMVGTQEGEMMISTNVGDSWTAPIPVVTQPIRQAVGYPGGFAAVAGRSVIASTNGLDWEVTAVTQYSMVDIAYGNGVFVAVADGIGSAVLISEDLKNWERLPLFTSLVYTTVEFANGRFVIGPSVNISEDGRNWRAVDGPAMTYITFSEGFFCSVSTSLFLGPFHLPQYYISQDGEHWHFLFESPSDMEMRIGRYFGRTLGITAYGGIMDIGGFGFVNLSRTASGSLDLQSIPSLSFSGAFESSTNLVSWTDWEQPLNSASGDRRFFRLKAAVSAE